MILDASGNVMTSIDRDDGKTVIRTQQDVEPIIEANKLGQTSGHDGYSHDRSMRHVAEIPVNIINKWMKDDGKLPSYFFQTMGKHEKAAYIRKKLADPNWAYLKAFGPAANRIYFGSS